MFSFRKVFLFAIAATSVFAVDYQTVLNDLAVVDQYTKDLGNLADSYTGTGAQSLTIQNKVSQLISKLQATTSDTQAATTPTTTQGQQVLNYINNPLYPDTTTTLTKTKNKRTAFTNAGLKPTILQYLKDVKKASDDLADALIAKAPSAQIASDGATAKANFDAAFNDAIAYFT